MSKIEKFVNFESLKNGDYIQDSQGIYMVTSEIQNETIGLVEMLYNEETDAFDICGDEMPCITFHDIKGACIY